MSNETIEIPLDQILLNDPNPRGFIDPVAVEALAASMNADGQKTDIKVRRLDNSQYRVVGGDHRVLAARKLGWTTIRASVLNITPDQAYLEGYLDNQGKPMGWFADYMAIEVLWKQTDGKKGSQKPIAVRLMKSEAVVSLALKLMPLLTATSREAILYQIKNGGDYEVTQRALLPLTGLATGQPDDQDRVEATLKVLLAQKMAELQAKNLVAWVKAGNPPETYGHQPPPQPAKASAESHKEPAQPHPVSQHVASTQVPKPTSQPAPAPTVVSTSPFWEWMAGISFISQIRSKLKKGEPLTGGEKALVGIWRFGQGLGWVGKHGLKLIHSIWKLFWKLFKDADKLIEHLFGKNISNLVHLALAIALACGLWYEVHHNPFHQFNGLVSKVFSTAWISSPAHASPIGESDQSPVAANPTPAVPVTPAQAPPAHASVVKPKPAPQRVVAAQTEDQKFLESELAALPANSPTLINPFAYAPGAMDADMATRRLEDLQDSEKYTVRLGPDQEKVLNIVMTASNCVLTAQSGLVGLLGDTSKIEIYWEDVKEIHASEIHSTKSFYQCSLLATGLKKPLTVQCATAENLERLISALEFKLKTSRGTIAPIVAMPYLNQGLRLDKNGVVTTLWADSPMDKAGLVLGDHVWSLEKNTEFQQSKIELEAGLQSLTASPHLLYKVGAAGWKRASDDMRTNGFDSIKPLRRTVKFEVS